MNDKGPVDPDSPDASTSNFNMIVGNNWAGITIDLNNNVVSDIRIGSILHEFKYTELGLTIADVSNLYGPPSNLLLDDLCPAYKNSRQNLIVIDRKRGVLAEAETQNLCVNNGVLPSHILVLPAFPVHEMIFFDPSGLESFPARLNINALHCNLNPDVLTWQGYITVDFSHTSSYCD